MDDIFFFRKVNRRNIELWIIFQPDGICPKFFFSCYRWCQRRSQKKFEVDLTNGWLVRAEIESFFFAFQNVYIYHGLNTRDYIGVFSASPDNRTTNENPNFGIPESGKKLKKISIFSMQILTSRRKYFNTIKITYRYNIYQNFKKIVREVFDIDMLYHEKRSINIYIKTQYPIYRHMNRSDTKFFFWKTLVLWLHIIYQNLVEIHRHNHYISRLVSLCISHIFKYIQLELFVTFLDLSLNIEI